MRLTSGSVLSGLFIVILCPFLTCFSVSHAIDTETLLNKMQSAYARVTDYQANVEVRTVQPQGSVETKKFLYTFKKPHRIRLDFESPHSGMILLFPDQKGKVAIYPSGWARIFSFHLAPDSSLLMDLSNQRIDQTDIGLLIKNLSRSLKDQRRGPVQFQEDNAHIEVRVLADDHFRKGQETLYHFFIDRNLWLPIAVQEFTPDGRLKRAVIFRNLRINTGISDSFFQIEGG
jgi:outer membrane lipoprotein-sorting protein